MMISGDDLERMLNRTMETKISCRKCQTSFTFENGANHARENGINEKVVMCIKCNSVYNVDVTPVGITLLDDVTHLYALPKNTFHNKTVKREAIQETSKKKWWQFWK